MGISNEVPRYPLHVIAGVVAAACLGLAFFFVGMNPHASFTAVDGSTGTVTCADVWTHWFHSDENTSVVNDGGEPLPPITLTTSANGSDDPTDAAYSAADTACGGAIGSNQGLTTLFFFVGFGAGVLAIVQKRRANQCELAAARKVMDPPH
jgi:hypothetical protein